MKQEYNFQAIKANQFEDFTVVATSFDEALTKARKIAKQIFGMWGTVAW